MRLRLKVSRNVRFSIKILFVDKWIKKNSSTSNNRKQINQVFIIYPHVVEVRGAFAHEEM